MDIVSTWKAVQADLELSISPVHYSTWIRPLSLTSLETMTDGSHLASVLTPSAYHQQIVTQRYLGQLERSLERVLGGKTTLSVLVGRDITESSSSKQHRQQLTPSLFSPNTIGQPVSTGSHNLNPKYTFDTYIVGASNNFAHAAAIGVAKTPGTRYNPLFIYGGVGLGKTHLMHAIGHAVFADHPDWNIMYISAETFGSDLIASLQNKRTAQFKKKYRSPNVLLVDDVQFIAGKEYIQEEFFHTFNELYLSGRQIVMTSDRPPQEISRIEERLSSRFMGGLTVDIQLPDFETRVAILTQKCQSLDIPAPADALSLIAERSPTNIRELEGVLQTILSKAASGADLTSDIVREYFGTEHERRSQRVRPNAVIAKTAQYFNFKPTELTGSSRKAPLVVARHVAMYLLYIDFDLPYEQIGDLFGGRDHTTVMHAVEKVAGELKTQAEIAKTIADIKHGL